MLPSRLRESSSSALRAFCVLLLFVLLFKLLPRPEDRSEETCWGTRCWIWLTTNGGGAGHNIRKSMAGA